MAELSNYSSSFPPLFSMLSHPQSPQSSQHAHSRYPDDFRGRAFSNDSLFPESHYLVLATAKGVYTWSHRGVLELFRSNSAGIVAAKKISSDSDFLAIADSQVMILHDISKGPQQSARLRGKHGLIRTIQYDEVLERLYFTTDLQNAVQSYAVPTGELQDPILIHPSPPTVFAISPCKSLLLSTSSKPPTILLTELSRHGAAQRPTMLQPTCSMSTVVAAAFHCTRPRVFALAFSDGTIAAYCSTCQKSDESTGSSPTSRENYHEIADLAFAHTAGITRSPEADNMNIGHVRSGITSIVFLPGFECRTASVGADGNCCIIDFHKNVAKVWKKWHVRGEATSLAAVPLSLATTSSRFKGLRQSLNDLASAPEILLAIGRGDGAVLLYNLFGKKLSLKRFHDDQQILSLEWFRVPETDYGDRGLDFPANSGKICSSIGTFEVVSVPNSSKPGPGTTLPVFPAQSDGAPRTLGTSSGRQTPRKEGLLSTVLPNFPLHSDQGYEEHASPPTGSTRHLEGGISTIEIASCTRMSGGSPALGASANPKGKKVAPGLISARTSSIKYGKSSSNSSKASQSRTSRTQPPTIPPRPVPRPGGLLARRRAQGESTHSLSAKMTHISKRGDETMEDGFAGAFEENAPTAEVVATKLASERRQDSTSESGPSIISLASLRRSPPSRPLPATPMLKLGELSLADIDLNVHGTAQRKIRDASPMIKSSSTSKHPHNQSSKKAMADSNGSCMHPIEYRIGATFEESYFRHEFSLFQERVMIELRKQRRWLEAIVKEQAGLKAAKRKVEIEALRNELADKEKSR